MVTSYCDDAGTSSLLLHMLRIKRFVITLMLAKVIAFGERIISHRCHSELHSICIEV